MSRELCVDEGCKNNLVPSDNMKKSLMIKCLKPFLAECFSQAVVKRTVVTYSCHCSIKIKVRFKEVFKSF